jgi:hypothetical protein
MPHSPGIVLATDRDDNGSCWQRRRCARCHGALLVVLALRGDGPQDSAGCHRAARETDLPFKQPIRERGTTEGVSELGSTGMELFAIGGWDRSAGANSVVRDFCRMKLMTQVKTQIPHPLTDHLPALLRGLRVTTPAVGVLLPIFIGEHRGTRTSMQIERYHISRCESSLGKGSKEQFVDQSFSQSAHWTLCCACRMGSDHHATPLFSRTNDQLRTIVEQTGGAAFRMGRRLDRGGVGDGPAPQVDQGVDSLCRASHRRTLPDPPRPPHCHNDHPGG